MTNLPQEELARLKALAERATPLPWLSAPGCFVYATDHEPWLDEETGLIRFYDGKPIRVNRFSLSISPGQGSTQAELQANADYIAALNPQVALRLIAEVERLRAVISETRTDMLEDYLKSQGLEIVDQTEVVANALQSKLAERGA